MTVLTRRQLGRASKLSREMHDAGSHRSYRTLPLAEALESRRLLSTTYFVDSAAASGGTGTQAKPFKTIQAAVNVVATGDTVNVLTGNYSESVSITNKVGTSTNPILIRRYGSGTVNLTSTAQTYHVGVVTLKDSSYVTIDGLNVNNGFWSAYEVSNGDHLTISNGVTYHNGASSVHTASTSYFSYLNNISDGDCSQQGTSTYRVQEIVSIAGSNYFWLTGNEIKNNPAPGSWIGGEGLDTKGSNHGVITYNKVHDIPNKPGIYLGAYANSTSDMECAFNIVYNCADGIDVTSEMGGLASDHRIHDNLVYNCRSNGINVTAYANDGPRDNISITNNTVYNNGWGSNSWGGGIQVESKNATNVRIANNISVDNHFWQIASSSPSQTFTSNNFVKGTIQNYTGRVSYGTAVTDIKFVNSAAFDFRIQYNSPARDAGISNADVSSSDLAGNMRQGVPDVGAYEYVPPAPISVTLAAASDTGIAGDNKTKLNNTSAAKLSFVVDGTVIGATVNVYAGPTLIGSTTANGATTTVLTNGTATIADGQASITATQTFAGPASAASTPALVISIDSTRPTLVGTPVINAGTALAASRSQIRTITWTFSEVVPVAITAFTLINRDTGSPVSLSTRVVQVNGNQVTVNLDRYGIDTSPNLFLADANYRLSLSPTAADEAGNILDANGDGTPGETPQFDFFKLLGDFTGDRRVRNADYLVWKTAYNSVVGASGVDAAFDLNASGNVSNADYLLWKNQYNRSLDVLTDGLVLG